MIIVWHLLSDPEARYRDLGPDWHARRTNRDKKIRTHIQGLQAPRRHRRHHRRRPRRLTRTTGHRNALTRPGTSHSRRARVSTPAHLR